MFFIPSVLTLVCLHLSVRVLCVGGDGSVAELCHALVLRAQLDTGSPEKPVKSTLPLGIIPAGKDRKRPHIELYHTDLRTVCKKCLPWLTSDVCLLLPLIFTGSTDVVSCSVHGVRDPVTAALHVILGSTCCNSIVSFLCFLGLSYTLTSSEQDHKYC